MLNMPKRENKAKMLGIRVSAEFMRRVRRAAKHAKRKPSDWARILIEDGVEASEVEHGELGHHSSVAKGENDA